MRPGPADLTFQGDNAFVNMFLLSVDRILLHCYSIHKFKLGVVTQFIIIYLLIAANEKQCLRRSSERTHFC